MLRKITALLFLAGCLLLDQRSIAQSAKKDTTRQKVFSLGVVDEIQSKELSEKRILNIYLPEGYNGKDTARYPVVYLLDGSADEDFIHIVGLYQFNSFSWVDRVPRSIVVGIASVDRRRDFTYPTRIEKDRIKYPTTGRSAAFISFIEKELQPFIDRKYKTNGSKTLIGQSLGGLVAAEILLTRPRMFNQYMIVSPSIWWDNASLLQRSSELLDSTFTTRINVYIGVGKEGVIPGDNPRVMEVDANLLADKIKSGKSKTVNVYFDYLPDEDHATILHQAIANAIKIFHSARK